jgi:hypothetical protein
MNKQFSVQFRVQVVNGSRLGILSFPLSELAKWLNFLCSPRQRATVVFTEQAETHLSLYFLADERLYSYLDGRLNCEVRAIHPENVMVGKALTKKLEVG